MGGYLKRKQRGRHQETPNLDYTSLLSHPQPLADLPDLSPPPQVAIQQRAPVPSRSYAALSPTGIGEGKESCADAALLSLPHPPASPASPLGEWYAAARRALALGTSRAAARTAGAQPRAGAGAARFAYAVGGAGGAGQWAAAWRDPAGRDPPPSLGPRPRAARSSLLGGRLGGEWKGTERLLILFFV